VLPRWKALNASKHLAEYPLARVELAHLAGLLGDEHWVKARSLQSERGDQNPQILECDEYQACERAILWFEKGESYTSDNSEPRFNFFYALLSRAQFIMCVSSNLHTPDEAYRLFEKALSDCQKAMKIAPDETYPRELTASILNNRAMYTLNVGDIDFIERLKRAEKDVVQGLQLDSENSILRGNLDRIREALGT
jgi:tetratricopeptide (TPR) repeat protein